MKPLFLIMMELNRKHKENGYQFLSHVFVGKEDSNVSWKHESTARLVQRFLKFYRKKHSVQFVTFFGKKKSLKNISQISMTVLKIFCTHLHFSSMTQSLINGFLRTLPDRSKSLA